MSNELSNELKAQIFAQQSADPYLTLVTMSGPGFIYRLVNNSKDVVSNGHTFTAFPMKVRTPVDDGESAREFQIDFDNASLQLIVALRSVTSPIDCQIDMILASMPNVIQASMTELLIKSISYSKDKISAKIILDNFLSVAMTSENYTPLNFPGMF